MFPACLQAALGGPDAGRLAGGCPTVVTAVLAFVAAIAAARIAWPASGRPWVGAGQRPTGFQSDPGPCGPVF